MQNTITMTINNKKVTAIPGETILTILRREGIEVPTLCHIEGLSPTGACRICLVELKNNNTLIPSCSHLAAGDMEIYTHSPRAIAARKQIIELIVANHPDDCLYCVRQGECELSRLAQMYGVRQRIRKTREERFSRDISNPSISRDPSKCILCGRCVRVCEEIQGVSAIDFTGRGSSTRIACACDENLNTSRCINCGQCIIHCPTGALSENDQVEEISALLNDPEKIIIFQHAPAISVSMAEVYGGKKGEDYADQLNGALHTLGAAYVFDTAYSADLTIMEEAAELVQRIKQNGPLPLFTSCSPGWIKFMEQWHPDMLGHLSTCKSPQQMLGSIIKTYFAAQENIDPAKIHLISIMPCTAKKFEAARPEHGKKGIPDVDTVITTRELFRLFNVYGINPLRCTPRPADIPFGSRSTAGKLFGASGGVMEAAIRTAHFLLTGKDLEDIQLKPLRGMEGIKYATVQIGDFTLRTAVVSGLQNASTLLKKIREGKEEFHSVEVMTCPGGCINGGGQPFVKNPKNIEVRMHALYKIDKTGTMPFSHKNMAVIELYENFLGQPLGKKSHELLHTTYTARDVM